MKREFMRLSRFCCCVCVGLFSRDSMVAESVVGGFALLRLGLNECPEDCGSGVGVALRDFSLR